jgi:pimeloyl-ACP methyl ester carboxylesterase
MTSSTSPIRTVESADGTRIAFDRAGEGKPVILIEAAGHYRGFSSFDGLTPLLSRALSVYRYDRRGRGDSTDTPPYTPEREVEDLAALIDSTGGSASLYAYSSGGLVALHAAAAGLPITRMALLEPPVAPDSDLASQQAFTAELAAQVAADGGDAAVEYYLTEIGVPAEILTDMRGTPSWTAMAAVAPTLVYDSLLSEATSFDLLAAVPVPTLVLDSEGSSTNITGMAAAVAAAMPHATHLSLAGEWHGVPDDVLGPVLTDFFTTGEPS